jgi:hypothetical protein
MLGWFRSVRSWSWIPAERHSLANSAVSPAGKPEAVHTNVAMSLIERHAMANSGMRIRRQLDRDRPSSEWPRYARQACCSMHHLATVSLSSSSGYCTLRRGASS